MSGKVPKNAISGKLVLVANLLFGSKVINIDPILPLVVGIRLIEFTPKLSVKTVEFRKSSPGNGGRYESSANGFASSGALIALNVPVGISPPSLPGIQG